MGDDLALDTGYPDLQDHLRLSTSTSRVASVDKRSATILGGGPAPGRGAGPAEPITCYYTVLYYAIRYTVHGDHRVRDHHTHRELG